MSDQPPSPPNAAEAKSRKTPVSSDMADYNLVSDTITGVNFRLKDNVLQAIFIFAAVVVGGIVGAILAALVPRWNLPWFGGALVGSFSGLIIGFFASGIFLMIYRGMRHLQGKHD